MYGVRLLLLTTYYLLYSPTPFTTRQVDVYSYGVLLAECLTSERPYAGVDPMLTLTPTPTLTPTRTLTTDPNPDPT